MPRTVEAPLTTSAYFKQLFRNNPELLEGSSNAAILERWQEDHPGETMTDKIMGNMANTKSLVRKELGIPSRRRKRKKGKKAATAAGPAMVAKRRVSVGHLETLEEKIDDVLTLARQHEAAGLGAVIRHLRDARNTVVMQQA